MYTGLKGIYNVTRMDFGGVGKRVRKIMFDSYLSITV